MTNTRNRKLNFMSIVVVMLIIFAGLYNTNAQQVETTEIKFIRFEHLATNVAEPIKVANWYKDNLGMKIIRQGGEPTFTTFIADPEENMMFEFYHNANNPQFEADKFNLLSLHTAFCVPDLNDTKEKLIKAGATIVEDTRKTPAGDQVLMLRDPWGLAIQFVQRSKPMLTTNGFRFEHIAINLQDSREVSKWYIKNFGLIVMQEAGAPNYGMFIADPKKNMMLEFYQNDKAPVINFNDVDFLSLHLASMTSDIAKTKEMLIKAGATVAQDINKTPSGDSILVLRDPWGFPLQFVQRAVPMLKF